jgi:hypothetical protein
MSNRDTFILNLMRKKGMTLDEAEAFAEDLDIPEAAAGPARTSQGAWQAGDSALIRPEVGQGDRATAAKFSVAATGQNGLTLTQQRGIDRGASLCPNCHEPEDDHLPGCARTPGIGSNFRAKTKATLPPAG